MAESKMIELYKSKDDCCGCGACMNACPRKAITMKEDEYGFIYPVIDQNLCIGCHACNNACAFQNIEETNRPIASYAAVNTNREQKLESASGGIFSAIASKVLDEGGVVFGCAMEFIEGQAITHHIAIDNKKDLIRLQGSKYVQSSTEYSFKEVMSYLQQGRKVLYSGTPCQVAGLKGYLHKDYENLLLIDIVCHGVPNSKFFNDFLDQLKEKKNYRSITGYSFRDKKKGWGHNCRIDAVDSHNKIRKLYTPARLVSYNTFFLDVLTCRNSCYSCKYACDKRPGDITVGDYWGISNEHPDILGKNGFDENEGISCIIVNTEKGREFIKGFDGYINVVVSEFDKISKMNKQLNMPSERSSKRDKIFDLYKNDGYEAVERLYRVKYRRQRIIHFVFNKLPRWLRNLLKSLK